MELRQLEYFVAVAEEANFTRAAERVHISQSGVSAQIRQLERELGADLIDRSGRAATLTPAGVAALDHARAALASAAAVREAVDEVNGLVRGRLVVGMVTGCTITALFDALAAFHRDHPGVEITLFEDNSDRLIESVRIGATDLALVGSAEQPPEGVDELPIISEGLAAAVPLDHPLAGRERASLAEICEHPLVCLPRGTGIRAVFDQACVAGGVKPDIALEASAPPAIADLATRGLGVAVLSESMAAAHHGRLASVGIDGVDSNAALTLMWRANAGPALKAFVRHAREAFRPVRSAAKARPHRAATARGRRTPVAAGTP
ncbi:LysR family transcriptional regulator [Rugosimonospora africana]|uniref:LysR family transcriptional regulator n=1 Tax=Rugosimonospora africana TaxID=556532 RepID=A0A8J3VPF1_9ACTN|nr:LysR substrate-binding domain-containing protein [Rugosimonospora africana]GIH13902.1 LysR family transcriptional regulator [Rugosimonospora africana]